jgi:hypothetical protein
MKRTYLKQIAIVLILTLMSAGLLTGCQSVLVVTGTGETITKTYDLKNFTTLKIYDSFSVTVKVGDPFKVRVTCQANLEESLKVTRQGDVLEVGLKPGSYTNISPKAIIVMPVLNNVILYENSRIYFSNFDSSPNMLMKLHDGAYVSGNLTCSHVEIDLWQGSRVNFTGSGQDLTVSSYEGSRVDLGSFIVNNAQLTITDGGTATVNVFGKLDVNLSNGADVLYIGDPTLGKVKLSEGATVDKKP